MTLKVNILILGVILTACADWVTCRAAMPHGTRSVPVSTVTADPCVVLKNAILAYRGEAYRQAGLQQRYSGTDLFTRFGEVSIKMENPIPRRQAPYTCSLSQNLPSVDPKFMGITESANNMMRLLVDFNIDSHRNPQVLNVAIQMGTKEYAYMRKVGEKTLISLTQEGRDAKLQLDTICTKYDAIIDNAHSTKVKISEMPPRGFCKNALIILADLFPEHAPQTRASQGHWITPKELK